MCKDFIVSLKMNNTSAGLLQYIHRRTDLRVPRGFTYIRGGFEGASQTYVAAHFSNTPPDPGIRVFAAKRSAIVPVWWVVYRNTCGGNFEFEGYCAEKRDGTFVELESSINVFGDTFANHVYMTVVRASGDGDGDFNVLKCTRGTQEIMDILPEPPYFDVLYRSLRSQLRSLQALSVISILDSDPSIWQEDGADEVVRMLIEDPENNAVGPLLTEMLMRRSHLE